MTERTAKQLANDQRLRDAAAKKRGVQEEIHQPDLGWIQTYTGQKFYPLRPTADQIHIRDIAHALSCTARFGGHTREFYSVAQHSVEVLKYVSNHDHAPVSAGTGTLLHALLHDAAEAYLGDLPRPIKHLHTFGAAYKEAENTIMAAVCERFGLNPQTPEIVEHGDAAILATEKRDLFDWHPTLEDDDWLHGKEQCEPVGWHIHAMPPQDAEFEFLRMWYIIKPQILVETVTGKKAAGKLHWGKPDWAEQKERDAVQDA